MSLMKYAESFEVLDVVSVPKNAGFARLARLRRDAHRHHFDYSPRPGYIYVRSRAISSRCNDNFDEFPAEEIKQAYRTFVGKPVFVNHHNSDHRRARGVIIDAALHEDTNPDGTPDTWAEVLMEVDAVRFPVLAREVLKGNIARTSMGTDVQFSVCTACNNKAYTPADYCQHIPRLKGMKIERRLASGRKETVVVAERCYGLGFFENSLLVEDPADPTAFTLGTDGTPETLAMFASIEREADSVVSEAEGLTREAAEAFYRSTDAEIYDHPVGGTRPKPEENKVPTKNYDLNFTDEEKKKPGFGGGSAEREREVQQGRDRMVERQHRQLWRENHPGERYPGPKVQRPASLQTVAADQCPGTGKRGEVTPYNAKGRAMTMVTCPDCGREWRKTGQSGGQSVTIPAHTSSKTAESAVTALMHVHSYGETKAPAKVDTMRAENCPVCGDDEGFNGDKCSVCGYMQPPSQFQDPDLNKAREQDLRQDQQEQAGMDPAAPDALGDEQPAEDLKCTNCGEVFSAEGDAASDPEPSGDEEPNPEEAAKSLDPGDGEDGDEPEADEPVDLSDLADLTDEELFDDEDDDGEDEDPEEDLAEPEHTTDAEELATNEGRITAEPEDDPSDLGNLKIEVNMTCPVCGMGTLVPTMDTPPGEPKANEVGATDPAKVKESVAMTQPNPAQERRNRIIAAIKEQQEIIDGQKKTLAQQGAWIGHLTTGLASLAIAAGVDKHPHFAGLVRQAGLQRAAADTNHSPEGAPATTTQDARTPDSTDDVENIGAVPGKANAEVTPDGTTDVNNSNVTANPPVLDNLQNVTAPTSGTDAVVPAAGDAAGTSTVNVGTPSNKAFGEGDSGWKSSARGTDQERFMASMRLARLQVAAGLVQGEDLALGEKIAQSEQTLGEITAQVQTLSAVVSKQAQAQAGPTTEQRRRLVPQAVRQATRVTPSMQADQPEVLTATGSSRPGEDEWLVGGTDYNED